MSDTSRRALLAALVLLAGVTAAAQDAPPNERFEAASIRPSAPTAPVPFSGTYIQRNRWRATNAPLILMIRSAYFEDGFVSEAQYVGGPDWIRTERWNVEAVAAEAAARAQFRAMVRDLLAERFKLRVRREQRELPVFVLTVARDDGRLGPNLTSVTVDCSEYDAAFARAQTPRRPPGAQGPATCDTLTAGRPDGTTMSGRAAEIRQLARMLPSYLGAPVVDRTGLSGRYDFELAFVREPLPQPSADTAPALGNGVVLPTALREQLGLRVERERAPVDVLVIESAERPTMD